MTVGKLGQDRGLGGWQDQQLWAMEISCSAKLQFIPWQLEAEGPEPSKGYRGATFRSRPPLALFNHSSLEVLSTLAAIPTEEVNTSWGGGDGERYTLFAHNMKFWLCLE